MSTLTIAPSFTRDRPAPRPVRRASGQVRLTRRGRLVVLAMAFVFAAALGVWLSSGSFATHEQGSAGSIEVVTVLPGDTLWGIASDAAAATGESDVRDMMSRIQGLNTLDSSVVYTGQELRVPAAD